MAAANEFTIEAVKDFMINNGGRVTNQQLVTNFKSFLNDPLAKVKNREKFKDFVNELANIKIEDNDKTKILVLKRKYRVDTPNDVEKTPQEEKQPVPAPRHNKNVRASSQPNTQDSTDGGGMSKPHSEEFYDSALKVKKDPGYDSGVDGLSTSTSTIASSDSQVSSTAPQTAEDANESISVKERAKHLNKMESKSDILLPNQFKKKNIRERMHTGEDHDEQYASFPSYGPGEKEWVLVCSSADYHEMNRLLSKNPALAKVRDCTNGFTALHWAAKHGKVDVIKMVTGIQGVNVNQRSYGGYTALHLAAIHGHEDIIHLLVQNFGANPNIRDYSGKKAKQYLKNSANSRTQQLLLTRTLHTTPKVSQSLDDSFIRTNVRKSNRSRAISSLIHATTSAGHRGRSSILRSSWGSSSEDMAEGATGGSSSGNASPSSHRKSSDPTDATLMPPPSAPTQRRSKSIRSSSQENMTKSASSIDERSLSSQSRSGSDSPVLKEKK